MGGDGSQWPYGNPEGSAVEGRVCPKTVGQLLAVVLQSGQPDKIGTHP
jgi:hypothetical protein